MSQHSLFGQLASALADDWTMQARPEQLMPPGDWWTIWMVMAGRGWGKTRTGAEFVRARQRAGSRRIALVGSTASDVRNVMLEGNSGLLRTSPKHERMIYEPSLRRVTWPNGAIAEAFAAEEPDRLRGPQFDDAWCDELAAWKHPEAFDQLMFGLRLGKNPRVIITTTPRPTKLVRELVVREGKDVVVTRGKTTDNLSNLSPVFLSQVVSKYQGTRLGRQELNAELLEDVAGALWKRADIDSTRVDPRALPPLRRIVVAIDPAISNGEDSDETGIIVAGIDDAGRGYLLEDRSDKYTPDQWAREAVASYHKWKANRVVAEVNQGGAMVEQTLRTVDHNIPYTAVHASRGKVIRAEPVSAFYEQRRISHVGFFPELEDQLCAFTSDYDRKQGSPDRLDALVWALTNLMVEQPAGWGTLEFYRLQSEAHTQATRPGPTVFMRAPTSFTGSHYGTIGGHMLPLANGLCAMSETDAACAKLQGWTPVEKELEHA